MPVIAILLGAVLIDLGFRGTQHEFAKQLGEDFSGTGFWAWLGAITIIGAFGYWSPLKRISDLGVTLVLFGLIFSNKGVISQFASALEHPEGAAPAVPLPSFKEIDVSSSSSSSGGSGGGGSYGELFSLGQTALSLYGSAYGL